MSPFWLWISLVAWGAWRKGSFEPFSSPRTEATAGTQHPALSRLPAHSNAMGHAVVRFSFSPRGLACLLHVSAEAAASGDCSHLSSCCHPIGASSGPPFLWSTVNAAYRMCAYYPSMSLLSCTWMFSTQFFVCNAVKKTQKKPKHTSNSNQSKQKSQLQHDHVARDIRRNQIKPENSVFGADQ